MGHKHTREEILAAALETALDEGLSQLSFGRVARRLGIPDRTVVYYFPTKVDLIGEVIGAMGARLMVQLAEAFREKSSDHRALAARAWPVLATAESDRIFALFFEANGLAAVGRPPYDRLIPELVAGWITWAAGFIEGDAATRQREAETAIAVIDGLLLMRLLAGPEAASRAAKNLGIA
jgi:AcrR family transcriptional regulator